MTQEEKAKAYDEAIKRAEAALKECGNNKGRINLIKSIFPDYKEDVDEEMRKWIYGVIWNLKYTNDEEAQKGTFALHWLDKQKKQKPVEQDDKDLPQGGELIMVNRILHSLKLYREMLKDSDFEEDYIKVTLDDCLEDEKWLMSLKTSLTQPH